MATQDTRTGLGLWRASECCTSVRGTLHSCANNINDRNILIFNVEYIFIFLNVTYFSIPN